MFTVPTVPLFVTAGPTDTDVVPTDVVPFELMIRLGAGRLGFTVLTDPLVVLIVGWLDVPVTPVVALLGGVGLTVLV